MSNPTTRRFFLGAATAAAATRVWGANEKINIGIVGLGGRGLQPSEEYSKDVRLAGSRDVRYRPGRPREGQRHAARTTAARRPKSSRTCGEASPSKGGGRRLDRHARITGTRWRPSGR